MQACVSCAGGVRVSLVRLVLCRAGGFVCVLGTELGDSALANIHGARGLNAREKVNVHTCQAWCRALRRHSSVVSEHTVTERAHTHTARHRREDQRPRNTQTSKVGFTSRASGCRSGEGAGSASTAQPPRCRHRDRAPPRRLEGDVPRCGIDCSNVEKACSPTIYGKT